jgi:hypothetical protein
MNDPTYVAEHTNGIVSNIAVLLIIGLGFVLALATIPLQLMPH